MLFLMHKTVDSTLFVMASTWYAAWVLPRGEIAFVDLMVFRGKVGLEVGRV